MSDLDLRTKQAVAAQYILDGFKASEVGKIFGVHRTTIWRWSQSPSYREVYTRGDAIPHLGRFRRLVERDPSVLTKVKSGNPAIAQGAAKKLLRTAKITDLLR